MVDLVGRVPAQRVSESLAITLEAHLTVLRLAIHDVKVADGVFLYVKLFCDRSLIVLLDAVLQYLAVD